MTPDYSSRENIRESLLGVSVKEAMEGEIDTSFDSQTIPTDNSRLTTPLKTAQRNVAQALVSIAALKPAQRKEACQSLIDISQDALKAVEKTLRRNGSADSVLLVDARKIIKLLDAFEVKFSSLVVKEEVEGELPREMEDPEVITTVNTIAYRVLSDNSDFGKDEAEQGETPEEGAANDATVNQEEGEGDPDVINALADGIPEEEGVVGESRKLPPTLGSKTDVASVHEESASNFQIMENIFKHL